MPKPPRRAREIRKGAGSRDSVAQGQTLIRRPVGRQRELFSTPLPDWIEPQFAELVKEAPGGAEWAHEIKFDGYRMHARIDGDDVRLLTRTGLNWTAKYPVMAEALRSLPLDRAYLDGELCGVWADGTTSFSAMQVAAEPASASGLVYYAFDLLHLGGEDLRPLSLADRKARLEMALRGADGRVQYSAHLIGDGQAFYRHACRLRVEGVVSKRLDAPYRSRNRGLWVKTKCLSREEFVVVGWTDPEGSRPFLGALLLAYYDPENRLVYAGRAGTGMSLQELKRVWERLQPLASDRMPLDVPPPRTSRFGSPLVLSRVHWVRPELVAEVTFLTWTDDGLLRHVVYQGLREDKPASKVKRPIPSAALPTD